MNQGILPIWCFMLDAILRAIPPEHRIVAQTEPDAEGEMRLLIEGPDMPAPVRGGIPMVGLLVQADDGLNDVVELSWVHLPAKRWVLALTPGPTV